MLAYLDALLAALAARDTSETDRLLAHPLARILSADARADATAERRAAGTGGPSVAPIHLLQLRYRTAQLLGEAATTGTAGADTITAAAATAAARAPAATAVDAAADSVVDSVAEHRRHSPQATPWPDRRPATRHQMELPLSA